MYPQVSKNGPLDERERQIIFCPYPYSEELNVDDRYHDSVRAWVNGTYNNYGLLLYSTGQNHIITYSSKENTAVNEHPRLDIIYTVSTATPTP